MTLTLYNNSSDPRVLNKTLSVIQSGISAQPVFPFSITRPSFVLTYNINFEQYTNYLYCDETRRFYFISGVVLLPGNKVQVSCHVDVLMTYSTYILNLDVTVIRNENDSHSFLIDSSYLYDARRELEYYVLPNNIFNVREADVTSYNFVLGLAGGSEGTPPNTSKKSQNETEGAKT